MSYFFEICLLKIYTHVNDLVTVALTVPRQFAADNLPLVALTGPRQFAADSLPRPICSRTVCRKKTNINNNDQR
jgi:hypothetical protein